MQELRPEATAAFRRPGGVSTVITASPSRGWGSPFAGSHEAPIGSRWMGVAALEGLAAATKTEVSMFLERAAKRWWTLVVRGVLAIAFGIFTVMVPQAAVMALVVIFGVYSIAEGVTSLSMFFSPNVEGTWLLGLGGIVSIAAGMLALLWPGITAVALFYVIAFWAIIIGAIELFAAVRYGREIQNEWAFVLSGLLWIGFGVIVLGWPGLGVIAILSLIAATAILHGVMLIVAGARLRKVHVKLDTTSGLRSNT